MELCALLNAPCAASWRTTRPRLESKSPNVSNLTWVAWTLSHTMKTRLRNSWSASRERKKMKRERQPKRVVLKEERERLPQIRKQKPLHPSKKNKRKRKLLLKLLKWPGLN